MLSKKVILRFLDARFIPAAHVPAEVGVSAQLAPPPLYSLAMNLSSNISPYSIHALLSYSYIPISCDMMVD